jgi:hypothetical protein
MSADIEHQKCIDQTISYIEQRGITCQDYEKLIGDNPSKRPDLLLPDFHTFIEVKTFSPQQEEREETQRLGQDFMAGKVTAYWHPDFFDRFGDDLRHSRRKFRDYPEYHTAVIFYDLHSIFHEQSPENLLRGQESWQVAFSENEAPQPYLAGYERTKRQLRRDKSRDIGAVAFHVDHNAFKIFHNRYAHPVRRIDRKIFALPDDEHFEYIDDKRDPKIVPLS